MKAVWQRIRLLIQLVILSGRTHPLIRRMITEAPGTYHHSLMVANLAEAALVAIDGDYLLGRVAAYFHDIGKISRPSFFIENQTSYANPHDTLTSKMSARIICNHVKDGLSLAEKYKLPLAVKEIIAQHHGTSVLHYFYKQAIEESKKNREPLPEESEYSYSGPKPVSREAAVVMLADMCEAAVRSLEKQTPAKITTLIDRLFKDKLESGQLDKCLCTLADLAIIRREFVAVLSGMFHHRIKYPTACEDAA